MDTLAIIKRIEMRLSELGMSKAEFYKASKISSASYSQWNTGLYQPSDKKLLSAAECLGVSFDYLKFGIEEKNKPALNEKDRRDIAKTLEELMEALDSAGDLMFDGNPISDEARESILAAMKLGLEAAKLKNKERFTPQKYKKG